MDATTKKKLQQELSKAIAELNAGGKLIRRCLRRMRRVAKSVDAAAAKRLGLKIA